ncbi:MAG: hypothetical protein ACR2G6_17885 [Gemmatimonadaceae bacterium]
MAPPNVTVFDYRLGVPMLLYGATTFTAVIQVAMPWFRSAGIYAGQLRKTADAIDRFVMRMQDESLARTEYTGQTVLQEKIWKVHDMARPTNGGPRYGIEQLYPDFAVGAFDLVSYSDSFMWERFGAAFPSGVDLGVRGLFNYDWVPPEGLWLDDIAAAANEQSRQDYARLQVVTGMLRLISTEAWLRYLSTPPAQSQTVSGSAGDSRYFIDEKPTTARSPAILPAGVIEHAATLKRYDARARVRVTTQEPGYVPAFRYRVVMRAIDSLFGNEGWDSNTYVDDVWQATYEPTQGDARCLRLRTELRKSSILSEVVLFEGPSPATPVMLSGVANLRATTFDWYVPVVSAASKCVDAQTEALTAATIVKTKSAAAEPRESMVGSGGVSIHLRGNPAWTSRPMQTMGGPAPLVKASVDSILDTDIVTILSAVSLENAERRHVRAEDVQIRWELAWIADKLTVRLWGKPEQRPFQVHVVVEEIVYSGETIPDNFTGLSSEAQFQEQIHTPFVAEMVNQLVFVAEEFFKEEQRGIEEGAKMWREFLRRFTESRTVGPRDPIEFLQESNRMLLTRSLSTATLATTIGEQVEFAIREAPRIWNEAVDASRRNGTEL